MPHDTDSSWGLVFDVDGVIADTEPLAMQATQDVFESFSGARVDEADMLAFMGSTAEAYFTALGKKYAPEAPVQDLIREHTRMLLKALGEAPHLLLPGVRPLFDQAAADPSGRVALATGSGRTRSEATIAACSLSVDAVRAWITGDDIDRPKPHPEIYLRAADALGLAPDRCVAIEDSVAGVRSAIAAGMACVAVTNTFDADALSQANRVVHSLNELTLAELRALI